MLSRRIISFGQSIYWGQDSAGNQQLLSYYCKDSTVDTFPIAFLYIFRGAGGEPVINFANTCNQWDFSGTDLANCTIMAADIKECQAAGKLITLSLGGATGKVGFSSDSQASSFADQVWNLFLRGESDIRPFGDVVLDGVDLDIESGTPAHYAAFVNRIRSNAGISKLNATSFALKAADTTSHTNATTHHANSNKTKATPVIDVTNKNKYYYITAAPQCPYPDAYIGAALNKAPFDAVYVQFVRTYPCNNYCGLDQPSEYKFATWDNWAKTKSANPDVKVYIGAAGSPDSAGEGYVSVSKLASYVWDAQEKYSSFGTNNRFDLGIKTAMASGTDPERDVAHSYATGQSSTDPATRHYPAFATARPVRLPTRQ
ncbi:glycoside hydrolase family 18 protein [Trametes sanguinea]|nr:glycoside hydrolase family 18 protein [Trametes sanguinea]